MDIRFSQNFSFISLIFGPFPYFLVGIFHTKLDAKLYSSFAYESLKKNKQQNNTVLLVNIVTRNTTY